jgi:hypothetical protein
MSTAGTSRILGSRITTAGSQQSSCVTEGWCIYDFHHSDLTWATFIGAKMQHAVLTVCVAQKADFTGADLTASDFFAAKLSKSDFRGADLRGVKFAASTLTWCKFNKGAMAAGWEDLPEIPDLRQQILQQLENGGRLDMSAWHKCQTTHCIAGWAIVLADAKFQSVRHNPALVGAGLFVRSDGMVPNFFGSEPEAMIWLKNPLNDPNAVA